MLDALVPVNEEAPDGTGYNDPPQNFKELTEEQFAQSGFHGARITHVEFRQMLVNDDMSPGKLSRGKLIQARLFWFDDDTGVAISSDYWKGKVRYFSFGCNHSLLDFNVSNLDVVRQYKQGMTYHCNKCKNPVKEQWMDLLVEDTGWSMDEGTSIPIRGIRDYNRTMKFSRPLEKSELTKLVKFLKKVDCPGWTGVGYRDRGNGTYSFTTTHDSSD